MDIATYGVGIFTPTLLAALALSGSDATFIADDISATEGTAVLDVFLVVGFAIAIFAVDRVGRVPLQITGFAVMAVALCILGISESLDGGGEEHLGLVLVGFALFNTFMEPGSERDDLCTSRGGVPRRDQSGRPRLRGRVGEARSRHRGLPVPDPAR
jgi:Sugar (and other) transporter